MDIIEFAKELKNLMEKYEVDSITPINENAKIEYCKKTNDLHISHYNFHGSNFNSKKTLETLLENRIDFTVIHKEEN